jgi:hypothetical protein
VLDTLSMDMSEQAFAAADRGCVLPIDNTFSDTRREASGRTRRQRATHVSIPVTEFDRHVIDLVFAPHFSAKQMPSIDLLAAEVQGRPTRSGGEPSSSAHSTGRHQGGRNVRAD